MEQVLQHFQLQPFPGGAEPGGQKIAGSLVRSRGTLLIRYRLAGGLDSVQWPAPVLLPYRCHGLWQNTCFEFFVGIKGTPGYWEVNFSSNGCWNVYHFVGYREEMREEDLVKALFCSISGDNSGRDFSCRLETSGIIENTSTVEVGVSAVLQYRNEELCYWALCHPGLKADFHDRRGFAIKLVGVAD